MKRFFIITAFLFVLSLCHSQSLTHVNSYMVGSNIHSYAKTHVVPKNKVWVITYMDELTSIVTSDFDISKTTGGAILIKSMDYNSKGVMYANLPIYLNPGTRMMISCVRAKYIKIDEYKESL